MADQDKPSAKGSVESRKKLAGASAVIPEVIRFVLDSHILFNVLPRSDKLELQPLFELKQYASGDVVARQDDPINGMYILYEGKVRHKQRVDGKIVSLGVAGAGTTMGELSLVSPSNWRYDAVAVEISTFLVLPADKVAEVVSRNKVIDEHFKNHVSLIEMSDLLRGVLGTEKYSADRYLEILNNLGVKNVAKDNHVFQQGEEDPRLYYIVKGHVELERTPLTGNMVVLDTVDRGNLIGESASLPELGNADTHPHSARALADVTTLVIREEDVKTILEENLELHDRLLARGNQVKDYEKDELDARDRSEGLDLRIKLADAVTEEEFLRLEGEEEVSTFPTVRQGDETEAGAACLTMVTNHYGKPFSLGQIRELTGLTAMTVTPMSVVTGAEALGFRSKAYSLNYGDLDKVKLPGIIGWESYHFVVLFGVEKNHVHVADPVDGIKRIPKDEFLPSWSAAEVPGVENADPESGVFIALEPTQKFELKEKVKRPIEHFLNYILPHKKYFGEALIAALIINLLGLASPLFIQTIVDNVVVHHDVSLLNMMLAGMALVAFFSTITSMAQSLLLGHTTARIDMRMMSEFYQHVLSLPMDFFMKRNKGEILARFGENQKIRAIIAGSTITVILNTLMVVVYFLMMFAYNVTLTIVVIIFIPFYISIVLYFTPRIKAIAQEIFLTNSQAQAYLIESLNGIEALKATANEYFARARWENSFAENVNRGYRSIKLNLMSNSFFQLATLSSTIVVLWLGANAVIRGEMTIGELMGFNMLMGLVTAPILQVVNLWNNLQEVRIAVDRVSDILTVDPERPLLADPSNMPATMTNCEGRIVFDKVNFSYVANEKTHYVMHDFDLVIEPGQRVAFVGQSGCGKSTIAKMILGFNLPVSGEMSIDGKRIETLDFGSLRRNIGVVLQDSFIFSGTVAENIALGDPQPDMQMVKEASHLAGADEFIINYPLAYQTAIGEKGMGISGGQRQRICIARALYHKPRILIFDEATSALDNESEERIMEKLEDILHNRTSITIAHRLSTILDSDFICFIKDGKVDEKGSHQELLDPDCLRENGYTGHYYAMAQSQFDLEPLKL